VIERLQDLHQFSQRAVTAVCAEMSEMLLLKNKGESWSEDRLWRLAVLSTFVCVYGSFKYACMCLLYTYRYVCI
jgi:hypothetical protein